MFSLANGKVLDSTPELELFDSTLNVESFRFATNSSCSGMLLSRVEVGSAIGAGGSSIIFSLIGNFCIKNAGFSFRMGHVSFFSLEGGLLLERSIVGRPPLEGMP